MAQLSMIRTLSARLPGVGVATPDSNHWGENVSHENLTPYALNLGARLTKIATASSRRFPQTVAAVFHATSSVNHVILPYSVSRRCPEDT